VKIIKKISEFKYIMLFITLFVGIMFYSNVIAVKKYQSKSIIALENNDNKEMNAAMSLLGLGSSSGNYLRDVKSLEEFLKTGYFLKRLNEKFKIKELYSNPEYTNFYERLSKNDYKEKYIERFFNNLEFFYNPDYSVIELSYVSHNNQLSADILAFTIQELESEINRLNKQKINLELKFVTKVVKQNKVSISKIQKDIRNYHKKYKIFNPEFNLEQKLTKLATLEEKNLEVSILYKEKSKFLSKSNPSLKKLKNKKYILGRQLKIAKSQLFVGGSKKTLNELLFTYKELEGNLLLKTEIYQKSVLKLEATKLDVMKKNKILTVITAPSVEEMPYFPNNNELIPTILVLLLLLIFILKSIISIIREHKN
jgi:capsule polysaccharide export protein KpsE/RkpR